ncbi:MAG: type II toxin-antitoxin system RelE/ParE family toxin [Bacteroidota bacterium]
MAYQIKVTQLAEDELDEAMEWYEEEKSGLGVAFLNHFFNRVAYLTESPYLYQEVYKTYRRVLMKKYPYAIYYQIDEQKQEVVVLAIWHTSKNLERLKNRLK